MIANIAWVLKFFGSILLGWEIIAVFAYFIIGGLGVEDDFWMKQLEIAIMGFILFFTGHFLQKRISKTKKQFSMISERFSDTVNFFLVFLILLLLFLIYFF